MLWLASDCLENSLPSSDRQLIFHFVRLKRNSLSLPDNLFIDELLGLLVQFPALSCRSSRERCWWRSRGWRRGRRPAWGSRNCSPGCRSITRFLLHLNNDIVHSLNEINYHTNILLRFLGEKGRGGSIQSIETTGRGFIYGQFCCFLKYEVLKQLQEHRHALPTCNICTDGLTIAHTHLGGCVYVWHTLKSAQVCVIAGYVCVVCVYRHAASMHARCSTCEYAIVRMCVLYVQILAAPWGFVLRVTLERIRARVVKTVFQVHRLAKQRCRQREEGREERWRDAEMAVETCAAVQSELLFLLFACFGPLEAKNKMPLLSPRASSQTKYNVAHRNLQTWK